MFTGLVEELGEIIHVDQVTDGIVLTVSGPTVTSDAKPGDSIAVSGVCLTVVELQERAFTTDVVNETLIRSTLKSVQVGDKVNLERAVSAGQRLGGHLVQGHVDGMGEFVSRESDGLTTFALPTHLSRYLVDKGSITVDGVSLTVVKAGVDQFTVALIPTTLQETTLGLRNPGDAVNLEVDVLAKYVEKLAGPYLREH